MTNNAPSPAPEIKPFWFKLRDVWLYPAKQASIIVIGIGAVLSLLVAYLPMIGIIRAFLDLAVISYVYKYGAEVLLHTARGNIDDAPEHVVSVDENQGWQQIKLFVGLYALGLVTFYYAPFTVAMIVGLILVLGYPAASIMVAVEGTVLSSLNPLRWLDAMLRIGWPYLAVVLLSACFIFSKFYLSEQLTFLWAPLVVLSTSAVSFYFAVMSFYLLGYLVYQYHQVLGFELAPTPPQLARTHSKLDPDQAVIDDCEALVVQGKLFEAGEQLRILINARGATALVHERYRKILKLNQDTPGLIAHGATWLSVLLAQDKLPEAMALFKECKALDAIFTPRVQEEFATLASAFSTAEPSLALGLLQSFCKQFPTSKLVPLNLLMAAKIMAQRLNDIAGAKKLVAQLQERYPASTHIGAINDYGAQLAGL
jgi:hypothetical protein